MVYGAAVTGSNRGQGQQQQRQQYSFHSTSLPSVSHGQPPGQFATYTSSRVSSITNTDTPSPIHTHQQHMYTVPLLHSYTIAYSIGIGPLFIHPKQLVGSPSPHNQSFIYQHLSLVSLHYQLFPTADTTANQLPSDNSKSRTHISRPTPTVTHSSTNNSNKT